MVDNPVIHSKIPNTTVYEKPARRDISYRAISGGSKIDSGGFAEVSVTTIDDTRIAVKEPNVEGTVARETIDSFLEEAEVWAQLDDHEHIVNVIDWGSRSPWIALEYVDGGSLETRRAGGGFGTLEALWVGICLSQAVQHAHRRGVVHLDLTPDNVLFQTTPDGQWDVPKITDWGVSKRMLEASDKAEGLTPNYAAPEQFDPDEYGNPDDFTDRFQLAVLVYEALTGEPAFPGSPTTAMRRILDEDVQPPTVVTPALPDRLDHIFERALAVEKADRYETVVNFRTDLVSVFETLAAQRGESTESVEHSKPETGAENDTETRLLGTGHSTDEPLEGNVRAGPTREATRETETQPDRPAGLLNIADDLDGVDMDTIRYLCRESNVGTDDAPRDDLLRLAVDTTDSSDGSAHVVGTVKTGTLSAGDEVKFLPSEHVVTVDTLEPGHGTGKQVDAAMPGERITIVTSESSETGAVSRGEVGAPPTAGPVSAEAFDVLLYIVEHPSVLTAGYAPVVHTNTAQQACRIESLDNRMIPQEQDSGTWRVEHSPEFAEPGEFVAATLSPTGSQTLALDTAEAIPETGWVTLRDAGQVVAFGFVTGTEPAADRPEAAGRGIDTVSRLPEQPLGERVPETPPFPSGTGEDTEWPRLLERFDREYSVPIPQGMSLRVPLADVSTLLRLGTVPVGTVQAGTLRTGEAVSVQPAGVEGVVERIELNNGAVTEAEPGDRVGFDVSSIDTDAIGRGDVCGPVDDPPTVAETFQAELFVIDHPSVITAGYTPVFHTHTAQVACTIDSIDEKIDVGSGETLTEDPDFIQSEEAATVTVRPQTPLCVEQFIEVPELGVFSVRDMGQTVAVGVIVGIEPAEG